MRARYKRPFSSSRDMALSNLLQLLTRPNLHIEGQLMRPQVRQPRLFSALYAHVVAGILAESLEAVCVRIYYLGREPRAQRGKVKPEDEILCGLDHRPYDHRMIPFHWNTLAKGRGLVWHCTHGSGIRPEPTIGPSLSLHTYVHGSTVTQSRTPDPNNCRRVRQHKGRWFSRHPATRESQQSSHGDPSVEEPHPLHWGHCCATRRYSCTCSYTLFTT